MLKLAFAQRPGEPPAAELIYECMVRKRGGEVCECHCVIECQARLQKSGAASHGSSQANCHAMLPSSHPDLQARYSNLLLVGPDSTVLAAAHQVGCHCCWQWGWARRACGQPLYTNTAQCLLRREAVRCADHSHILHCSLLPLCLMPQVGQRMSSVRHVQVGGRWDPPPPASGLDPDACTSADEWREVLCRLAAEAPADRRPTLQQVAVRGFRGVSPQLARDLAQLAGVAPDALPAELSPQQWAALWQAWQGWLAALDSGSFAATACPTSGAYSLLGAQPQPVPSLLPFLAAYYSAEQRADAFAALKQQLVKTVAGAIARLHVRTGRAEGWMMVAGVHRGTRSLLLCSLLLAWPQCLSPAVRLPSSAHMLNPAWPCPSHLPLPQKKVESLQKQGGDGDRHQATQKQADMIMANVYRWGRGRGELNSGVRVCRGGCGQLGAMAGRTAGSWCRAGCTCCPPPACHP